MRGLLLVAGGLILLVTVVAAASRSDRLTPERGGGASETVRDYFFSTYIVVSLVVFLAMVFLLVKERETLQTKRSKHGGVRQLVQFAAVMLVLLVAGPYIWKALRGDRDKERPNASPNAAEIQRQRKQAAKQDQARFRWEPLVAVGALGLVSLAVLARMRTRRRDQVGDDGMAEALAAVLDDALADLRADHDLRRATIAAYARMERLLAAHRVPRRPAEAPFEYLSRVLLELDTSAASVFELTALFERAKFSQHTIDEGMRDEAIAALVAVRDELRGTA